MLPSTRFQRHGACGCGSGRPFRVCCAPWEEVLQRLTARLVTFADGPAVAPLQAAAADLFSGATQASPRRATAQNLQFLEWFLHDYEPARGAGTLLGAFADRTTDLEAREQELLFELLLTPMRVYQVAEPLGLRGAQLKDLLGGAEGFAGPLGFQQPPIKSDILVCRIVAFGAQRRPGLAVLRLASAAREELLAYLRTAYQIARAGRHVPFEDFVDGAAHLYHHFFELRRHSLGGRAESSLDPAPFAPVLARYQTGEPARVRTALDRQLQLEREAGGTQEREDAWVLLKDGLTRARLRLVPGHVEVRGETGEALREARTFVESTLRGLIQVPGDIRPEAPGAPASETAHPSGGAFLRRMVAGWADRPSRVLEGRTPRQASEARTGREEVAALLRGLERDLGRQKRLGRAWVDLGPVREALKLAVPPPVRSPRPVLPPRSRPPRRPPRRPAGRRSRP